MLMHLLSIAIGFVVIILLLSIAVTGIVEAAQSLLRLRTKILRDGLNDLFVAAADGEVDGVIDRFDRIRSAYPNLVPRRRITRTQVRAVAQMIDPAWATGASTKIDGLFKLMEERTTEIFKQRLRFINVSAGFAVAFLFQASAFDLLVRLNTDAVFLSQAVALGVQLNEDGVAVVAPDDAEPRTLEETVRSLELLGLRPWAEPGYYCEQPLSRIVGVLFTGALLSLGAPFWFDVLAGLVGLLRSRRDTD